MTDARAVSAVLGYVITLGIVTLLVSGLFMAAGDFVQSEHERAIRSELEVVGNRMAADIAAVDRLALAADADGEVRLRTDMPARAAGASYQIEISQSAVSSDVYHLNLTTRDPRVTVEVRVRTATALTEGTVNGGDVVVVYDGTTLEVRHG